MKIKEKIKKISSILYDNTFLKNSIPDFLWIKTGVLSPFIKLLLQKKIDKIKIKNFNKRKILFLRMRFMDRMMTAELSLANQISSMGGECIFAYCNSILPVCIAWDGIPEQERKDYCKYCERNNQKLSKIVPFRSLFLKEYIDKNEIAENNDGLINKDINNITLGKTNVGNELFLTTAKYMLRGSIPKTPDSDKVVKKFIKAGIILENGMRKMFEIEKPDAVVLNCGHIFWYGIAYKILKELDIKTITYDETNVNVAKLGWIFDDKNECVDFKWDKIWNEHKIIPLTSDQRVQIEELLLNRKSMFLYKTTSDLSPLSSKYDISRYKKKFALFTNLVWDATIVGRDTIFQNMSEWIKATIEFFESRKDYCLIIRIHPAEAGVYGLVSNERTIDEIREFRPKLPENIIVIRPDEKINSYDIIDNTDIILNYASNVGLEAILSGKTVINTGPAHFMNKGFALEPKSAKEYLEILGKIIQSDNFEMKMDREQILRYAYFAFIEGQIDLNIFPEETPYLVRKLNFENFQETIVSNKYTTLNKLAKWILFNKNDKDEGFLTNTSLEKINNEIENK